MAMGLRSIQYPGGELAASQDVISKLRSTIFKRSSYHAGGWQLLDGVVYGVGPCGVHGHMPGAAPPLS